MAKKLTNILLVLLLIISLGYTLRPELESVKLVDSAFCSVMLIEDVDNYVSDIGWHPPLIWPIHDVRKPWVLQSDSRTWYNGVPPDSTWKEWFDTSGDWYSWNISETF